MPTDRSAQPWAIRSTLLAVTDLDRSVAFFREVGPFDELARMDAVAVIGKASAASILLILRETRSTHHIRHGQQSLGLRSITFNVGSLSELDRIESVLRDHNLFTSRQTIADDACEIVRGRDPDNQPLVFAHYAEDKTLGSDYFQAVSNLVYSLDA